MRAAILAAPDDDDLRLIFADLLVERGDPRGELIQLRPGAFPKLRVLEPPRPR